VTDTSASLQVSRFMGWWVEELARLFAPQPPAVKPWQAMLLRAGEGFEVHVRQGRGVQLLARLDPDTTAEHARAITADLARRGVSRDTTVLRLAPSEVVATRLSLPAGVRDMLDPVIRNQIERLAPWPADQALFAYCEAETNTETSQIGVDVWIVGRGRLEKIVADLTELGFTTDTVDAAEGITDEPRFNLLGPREDDFQQRRVRIRRVLSTAGALALIGCAASLAYVYYLDKQRDELDRTVSGELRAAMSATTPHAAEARRQRELVLGQRQRSPSMSVTLEMLSRALPDNAYLERIEMRDGVLTFSGRADNVPALIGPLEETQHFENVQFAAPTTRREGDARDEFSLSLRVKPLMSMDRPR
jgi:general secretion pathway protein L